MTFSRMWKLKREEMKKQMGRSMIKVAEFTSEN